MSFDHLDLPGKVQRWTGVRTPGRIASDTEEAHEAAVAPGAFPLDFKST